MPFLFCKQNRWVINNVIRTTKRPSTSNSGNRIKVSFSNVCCSSFERFVQMNNPLYDNIKKVLMDSKTSSSISVIILIFPLYTIHNRIVQSCVMEFKNNTLKTNRKCAIYILYISGLIIWQVVHLFFANYEYSFIIKTDFSGIIGVFFCCFTKLLVN